MGWPTNDRVHQREDGNVTASQIAILTGLETQSVLGNLSNLQQYGRPNVERLGFTWEVDRYYSYFLTPERAALYVREVLVPIMIRRGGRVQTTKDFLESQPFPGSPVEEQLPAPLEAAVTDAIDSLDEEEDRNVRLARSWNQPTMPAAEPEVSPAAPSTAENEDAEDEALDLAEYNASVAHLSDAELNTGPWEAGDPEPETQPRTMDAWDKWAERVRLGILTYPGERHANGKPTTEGLRLYTGLPDIKHQYRTEVWRELGSPAAPTLSERWIRAWNEL